MSNQLIPQNFGQVASVFQGVSVENDLSSGIQSSFGLIGYKGKVWSIRYRGEETQLMRDDGDGPRSSIELVIVKASKNVSKIWYEQGYVEGSNAAPDCFSNNGVTPDPTSNKKQCDTCALCPHNQWGSRITPAGKAGKACTDSKRVAVVPAADLYNDVYGGPMLLRIPAASLQDMAMFGDKMQQLGYPYFSIITKVAFDPAESYPKFKFSAVRPLSEEEAKVILGHRDSHAVERILSENEFVAAAEPAKPSAADIAAAFEQPPADVQQAAQATQPAQKPAQQAAGSTFGGAGDQTTTQQAEPAQTASPAQQQASVQQETIVEEVDDEEAKLLAALEAARKKKMAAQASTQQTATIEGNTVQQDAPSPETEAADTNMASDFESNLDDMLSKILPG